VLGDFDYDEPAFDTAETKSGRLDRLRFVDEGIEIVLTRCLPEMFKDAQVDLFKGHAIETATLDELRERLK